MAQKKVSDCIAEFLKEKGIKHAFGIIGSGNAHIFDSIYQLGFTEMVCVHHEQAAVMALQTYCRVTGKLAAAVVTTGAGSSNAVTGVVSLWMDSMPGIIISGNENSRFTQTSNPLRIWGIQGYDSTAMVSKVTKYAKRILEPKEINRELHKAYDISDSGKPGPVWIDVPMNIQAAPVEETELLQKETLNLEVSNPQLSKQVSQILFDLGKAKRPVLWLGNGIRHAKAVDLVGPLLDQLKIPALVSWAGIDLVDSHHPLVMGRAGIYGQRSANFVLQNSDYVLAIGTRLAVPQVGYDLTELARAAKIAVVDIDKDEAHKHGERTYLPVVSDAGDFLREFLSQAKKEIPTPVKEWGAWVEKCHVYRKKYPWIGPEHADKEGFINSYPFMDKISDHLKPGHLVVTDMGTALLSGHQALRLKKGQRLMTSTGLGEMGFGTSAAIGASFADKSLGKSGEVLCLNCDGGMMMNLQELQTIAHHKLPIKFIIFNNDGYLMIKHTQKALFKGRYTGTDLKSGVSCPDYTKLGKAFDFATYQIRSWQDFDSVMPKFFNEKGPTFCEVFMHPEQLFVPKLALAPQKDGSIISPPLEDLLPLLPRKELKENMIVGIHPKSEQIQDT